jgi:serine/threonine protein kinase
VDDPEAVLAFSWKWVKICISLLDAVEAVHARGVIIGDISPANALVNLETFEVTLIDFEGALLSEAGEEITRLGTQWFNPGFRRPAGRGAKSLSPFDDFYSCGMLLYNIVCPIQPLFELDKNQPIFRILNHFIDHGLPAQIRSIIQTLMAGDPVEARRQAVAWELPEPPAAKVAEGLLALTETKF